MFLVCLVLETPWLSHSIVLFDLSSDGVHARSSNHREIRKNPCNQTSYRSSIQYRPSLLYLTQRRLGQVPSIPASYDLQRRLEKFRCTHRRYTIRAWCTIYETTHIRCRPSIVDINFQYVRNLPLLFILTNDTDRKNVVVCDVTTLFGCQYLILVLGDCRTRKYPGWGDWTQELTKPSTQSRSGMAIKKPNKSNKAIPKPSLAMRPAVAKLQSQVTYSDWNSEESLKYLERAGTYSFSVQVSLEPHREDQCTAGTLWYIPLASFSPRLTPDHFLHHLAYFDYLIPAKYEGLVLLGKKLFDLERLLLNTCFEIRADWDLTRALGVWRPAYGFFFGCNTVHGRFDRIRVHSIGVGEWTLGAGDEAKKIWALIKRVREMVIEELTSRWTFTGVFSEYFYSGRILAWKY